MTLDDFYQNFDIIAEAPNGVAKLRKMILELAVQGKLASQDPNDESASILLERIAIGHKSRANSRTLIPNEYLSAVTTLPTGWSIARLGDIASIIRGITFPSSAKSRIKEPDHIACLRTTNVQAKIEWEDLLYVPIKYVQRDDQIVKSGDIIISMANSYDLVGKVAQVCNVPENATFGGFIATIRSEGINLGYLLTLLRSPGMQQKFRRGSKQTTNIANISLGIILPLEIPIPPLKEQLRIVAQVDKLMVLCDEIEARQQRKQRSKIVLNISALDHLTNATEPKEFTKHWDLICNNFDTLYSVPESVGQLRQTMLQLAVQGKLTKYIPAFIDSKGKVTSGESEGVNPASDIPGHWCRYTFGEIADIRGGVTLGRDLGSKNTIGCPYLRVANVQRGYLDLSVIKNIDVPIGELEKYGLHCNDLLIVEGGDWDKVGRTAIWHNEIAGCIHQNHIFRARLKSKSIRPRWIELFLNSRLGRNYFEEASKQTTNLASINMTQLRSCPIPLPPMNEQDAIIKMADMITMLCAQLESAIKRRGTFASHFSETMVREMVA